MRKKVLHILSGDLWAGKESQVLHQAYAQTKFCEIQVLLFNETATSSKFLEKSLPTKIIPEKNGFINLLKETLRFTKENPPEIIVSHDYKESFLGFVIKTYFKIKAITNKQLKVPKLFCVFHGMPEPAKGFKKVNNFVYSNLRLLIAKYGTDKVITVSHKLAENLGFLKSPRIKNNLEIIFNILPDEAFEKTPSANGNQIDNNSLKANKIVIVGRLVPVKRIDLALKSFEELLKKHPFIKQTGVELEIIGDGPLKESLTTLAKSLDIDSQVHFLGFSNEAFQKIKEAKVLLITSDSEGIPTVLLEALASNTSIVTTEVGGIREVYEIISSINPDYNFSLCPAGDYEAISKALAKVLEQDEQNYKEFSSQSSDKPNNYLNPREFYQVFSAEGAAIKFYEIIRGI